MYFRTIATLLLLTCYLRGSSSTGYYRGYTRAANAFIFDANNLQKQIGYVYFIQNHGSVTIYGSIRGLSSGFHGFHIHQNASLNDACAAAGPHYNPFMLDHGSSTSPSRHVGDLGNIFTCSGCSETKIFKKDNVVSLSPNDGVRNILGRAVVVHAMEDDLGLGGDLESTQTGNAGRRVGCGIVSQIRYL